MRRLPPLLVVLTLLALPMQGGAAETATVTLGAGDRLGERMFSRPLRRALYESGVRTQRRPQELDLEAWLAEWSRVRGESPRPELPATHPRE